MNEQQIQGADHEINFWKGFVKTERFLDGWVRKDIVTPELREIVRDFIKERITNDCSVLDVGSGVVSILNGLVPDKNLFACDLLGDKYSEIFDYSKYRLTSPKAIGAESLDQHYSKEQFDIVHISNALDHCQNPALALQNLFEVCKKDGYVIIQGFENEAIFEKWQGFHQWNISIKDNLLVIKGEKFAFKFGSDKEVLMSQIIKLDTGKNWVVWIARK